MNEHVPLATGKILTDIQILQAIFTRRIVVAPLLSPHQIGANTLDLRLGTHFILKRMDRMSHLDPVALHKRQLTDPERVLQYYEVVKREVPIEPFILHQGQFVLGCTLEYIRLPADIGAILEGRSTWAREGLKVHSTASLIHPGHDGIIVFELENTTSMAISLYPGVRVAQLLFYEQTAESAQPYAKSRRSKYVRYMATGYGKPWEDGEFELIQDALSRSQRPPAS